MADPDMDRADIFRESMKVFVRMQAAKRLAALGGAMPDMPHVPRRPEEVSVNHDGLLSRAKRTARRQMVLRAAASGTRQCPLAYSLG